ncbi:trichohyalin [Cyclospora cayetanensis]|uniref:Trichohyalin n=1 Tax=Cyclospora cayetanensis TaxID=88456 RepID=A0A6P6RVZ1_9EIME|nr:trichohyalin [Cyclospora cayetanensis]
MEAVSSDGELQGPTKASKACVELAMLGEMQTVIEDLCKELQEVRSETAPQLSQGSGSNASLPRQFPNLSPGHAALGDLAGSSSMKPSVERCIARLHGALISHGAAKLVSSLFSLLCVLKLQAQHKTNDGLLDRLDRHRAEEQKQLETIEELQRELDTSKKELLQQRALRKELETLRAENGSLHEEVELLQQAVQSASSSLKAKVEQSSLPASPTQTSAGRRLCKAGSAEELRKELDKANKELKRQLTQSAQKDSVIEGLREAVRVLQQETPRMQLPLHHLASSTQLPGSSALPDFASRQGSRPSSLAAQMQMKAFGAPPPRQYRRLERVTSLQSSVSAEASGSLAAELASEGTEQQHEETRTLQEALTEATQREAEAKLELQRLREETQRLREAETTAANRAANREAELERECEVLRQLQQQLAAERDSKADELLNLQLELQKQEATKRELSARCAAVAASEKELQHQTEEQREQLQQLQNQRQQERETQQQQLELQKQHYGELEEQHALMVQQLQSRESAAEQLENELQQMKQKQEQLHSELEEQREASRARDVQRDQLAEQLERRQQEVEQLQQHRQELETQVEQHKIQLEQQRQQLEREQQQRLSALVSQQEAEGDRQQELLRESQEEALRLQREKAELTQELAELQKIADELRHQQELHAQQQEVAEKQQEVQLKELQLHLSTEKEHSAEVKKQLHATEQSLTEALKDRQRLEQCVDQLQSQCAAASEHAAEREREVESYLKREAELERVLLSLGETKETDPAREAGLEASVTETLRRYSQQLAEQEAASQEMKRELEKHRQHVTELLEETENAKQQQKQQGDLLRDAQQKAIEHEANCKILAAQVFRLQQQLDQSEKAQAELQEHIKGHFHNTHVDAAAVETNSVESKTDVESGLGEEQPAVSTESQQLRQQLEDLRLQYNELERASDKVLRRANEQTLARRDLETKIQALEKKLQHRRVQVETMLELNEAITMEKEEILTRATDTLRKARADCIRLGHLALRRAPKEAPSAAATVDGSDKKNMTSQNSGGITSSCFANRRNLRQVEMYRPVALNIHDLASGATFRSFGSTSSSPRVGDLLDMIPNIPNPLDLVKQIKSGIFRKNTADMPAKQQEPVIPSSSSSDSDGPTTRPHAVVSLRQRRQSGMSLEHLGSCDRWKPSISSSESGLEVSPTEGPTGVRSAETIPTTASFTTESGQELPKHLADKGVLETAAPRQRILMHMRANRGPTANQYIDVEHRRFLAYSRSDSDS